MSKPSHRTMGMRPKLIGLWPGSSPQRRGQGEKVRKQQRIQTAPNAINDLVCNIGSTHVVDVIHCCFV
jgi:hypothetical protein